MIVRKMSLLTCLIAMLWGPTPASAGQPTTRQYDQVALAIPGQRSEAELKAVRVGGNIRPPVKIKDVKPQLPAEAVQARVQGVVIMEITIDESGNVADVRVLRSIPLLDQAAVDAVRQWEFMPTLLNGTAVPVIMTVTVQFTLAEGR